MLLILQGPGLPMINKAGRFERVLALEQAFTVAYWDQRGCGRSLRVRKGDDDISLERMVGDTVTVLEEPQEIFQSARAAVGRRARRRGLYRVIGITVS